jgi:hypothetical protein
MSGFKIVDTGDGYEVIDVFGGTETHLTFVDSFRAAMLFICARRQVSIPRYSSFTIECVGKPL